MDYGSCELYEQIGDNRRIARARRVSALAVAVAFALIALITVVGMPTAIAGGPAGSVKLPPSKVVKFGPVTCGQIKSDWQAGIYRSGYFLTFLAKYEIVREKAVQAKDKKKRDKLFKKASALHKKARRLNKVCEAAGEAGGQLRFDFKQARGLALLDLPRGRSATGSAAAFAGKTNLDAVAADGSTEEAAISGTAKIKKFLIAPDDTVYLLFVEPVDLDVTNPADPECLLARVDPDSGRPTCVDDSLVMVDWPDDTTLSNDAIQFGPGGAIYYSGLTAANKTVLRRVVAGRTTDLITDYMYLSDFLVLPDGSVITTGQTKSTGSQWTRRVAPQGGLQTIAPEQMQFLDRYPDGNVYMGGFWSQYSLAVGRFLTATNQLDTKYWIGSSSAEPAADFYFDRDAFCSDGQAATRAGFCQGNGAMLRDSATTSDGQVFVIAGSGANNILARYYPGLVFPDIAIRPTAVVAAGRKLVLAGLSGTGQNVISIYDPASDEAATVVGPDNEIEAYHFSYSPSRNEVLFDGLRFSDNTYVLGRIDMDTNAVTVSPAGDQRWEDFEAFG